VTNEGKSKYAEFLQQTARREPAADNAPESQLDSLLHRLEQRREDASTRPPAPKVDPLDQLRTRILEDLMPVVMELAEKYAGKGITLRMDAGKFLQGGRSVELEFKYGPFRTCLHGTVTAEGIAFEETRYAPDIDGEIASGPMLRMRQLNAAAFRDFLCEQLANLLRVAMRRS